jgi:hypothetical protein
MIERRLTYFGFELETELETLEDGVPDDLLPAAREALAAALLQGETTHPDQNRVRRLLEELGELWRRSGGTLEQLSPAALRDRIRAQLEDVGGWQDFQRSRISLNRDDLVDPATRMQLESLPGHIHLKGDAVPLSYEVQNGEGIARARLREGQAKRLRAEELPRLDRPLRFAVQRGRHPPLLADSISDLHALLRRTPREAEDDGNVRHHRGGHRRERSGHGGGRRGRRNDRRRH